MRNTTTEARVVVGLYDHLSDAHKVIRDLLVNGFKREDLSLLAGDSAGEYARLAKGQVTTKESNMWEGSTIGSIVGGLGGLLIGLGALAIPGIGPVLAAGPLFGAFFGAAAGTVAGGFIGAFADWGIRDQEAHLYAEGVRRGGALVAVKAEGGDRIRASELMNRHNPIDIEQRAVQWRKEGWKGFDPNAKQEALQNAPRDPEQIRQAEQEGKALPTVPNEAELRGGEDSALRAGKLPGLQSFEALDADFREHYARQYANSGRSYEYYLAGYRYGYNLANDERFADKDWAFIEHELRRFWEEYDAYRWDDFKDGIKFAREKARQRP
jgi:uncharacterized membrane protein